MWSQLPTVFKIPKVKPSEIKENKVNIIVIIIFILKMLLLLVKIIINITKNYFIYNRKMIKIKMVIIIMLN